MASNLKVIIKVSYYNSEEWHPFYFVMGIYFKEALCFGSNVVLIVSWI